MLSHLGSHLIRTAYRSPWQNGIAERWIGSCRRELLDQVMVLNEHHLRRLIRDYIRYYHEDRIHDSLSKDTPERRPLEPRGGLDLKLWPCLASADYIIGTPGIEPRDRAA